ncbi:MAG: DNA polymerase I [Paludibacteraceae bacterium]|nr:DNA polymerase I [Paludibacteraceae bacterium]
MEKKLFLLDAYAIIYRAYYALIKSPRINSKGFNTSAVLGFVNTLEDVLKTCKPTHFAVCFDPSGPTFRHRMYEPYKAQRQATPEDIKLSVPIIKQLLEAYNIPIIEVSDFEADDVIGTVSHLAEKEGFDVYMVTPDKDYAQLVTDHIFMYRPRHGVGYDTMGVEEVKEKWSVSSTNQIIDLLGLMGDSSDNIPGCPGVGEKTAIKLLQDFESIENLLSSTDQLKGALKTKIETNVENIKLSQFLATIRLDVPYEFHEEDLILKSPSLEKLIPIFKELEFKSLLSKYDSVKIKSQPTQLSLFDEFTSESTEEKKFSILSELTSIKHNYQLIENQEDISKILPFFDSHDFFCFDTETTGISPLSDQLVGISFCFQEGEAFFVYLPVDREKALEYLSYFKPYLENPSIIKIGQNIKFDILFLKAYGINVQGPLFDTMIAHYLLQPELKHNMDYLAEVYLNYKTITYEDICGAKGKGQLPIRQVNHSLLSDYACEDVDVTLKLKNILSPLISENSLDYLFNEIEMPLIYVLASMEWEGVRIDVDALHTISINLTQKLSEIENKVYEIVGSPFNLSSPKQVGEIIFDKLQLDEKARKTKTGQYSTSEEVLESLRGKHPVIDLILEYRGIKKLLSTYVDTLPTLIHPVTGKVHTSFNQAVTATGRLSSSNPNLQNIPVRDELGKEIRKAFIADKDCKFVSADYSQIELRLLAHLSKDENMVNAFNSDSDIHSSTASKIFKVDISEVTSDMRRKAKTANFGIIYGISIFGLAERLSIPRAEAKTLIEDYYATYPTIQSYMTSVIEQARQSGYVETLFHRKRFLPDINSRNATVRGFAERNAINAPIQGTAADIIKIAMVKIYNRIQKENLQSKMILQIHDELNFNVPNYEVDQLTTIIKEEMESAIQLVVPLIADCGVGNNWLEAH